MAKRPRRQEAREREPLDKQRSESEVRPMHRDVADVICNQLSEQLGGVRRMLLLRTISGR